MAETPLCAYARAKEAGLTAGTKLTMTVVYKYTPSSQLRAYLEGQKASTPFTFVSVAHLVDVTGRSRSLVYDDLKALEAAGVLAQARRVVEGRERDGWVLPLRGEPGLVGADGGQQCHPASDLPDVAPAAVRPAGHPASDPPEVQARPPRRASAPPDPEVRPAGPKSPTGRTKVSGRPDENMCSNSEENKNSNLVAAAAESREVRETRARATPAAPSRPVQPTAPSSPPVTGAGPRARRPVATIDGEPAGSGLTAARELLRELGAMFSPTDATGRVITTQQVRPNDPATLVRAEQLLAVPLEGLDEDAARRARSERLAYVLDVCRRFADLCRSDKTKARWWGPAMLEQTPPAGKTLSRWAMLERDVAEADRAAGDAEAKARAAASAAAAVRAPTPATAADVARADRALKEFQALVGGLGAAMRPGAARVVGGRAVAPTERDEEAEIERARQLNAALVEARRAKGAPLTDAEADYIRQRMNPEGART